MTKHGRKVKRKKMSHVHLGPERMTALQEFQRDLVTAMPQIGEITTSARQVFDEMVHAKTWNIVESEKPEDMVDRIQQSMSIGHAQVNYVDHIETKRSQ